MCPKYCKSEDGYVKTVHEKVMYLVEDNEGNECSINALSQKWGQVTGNVKEVINGIATVIGMLTSKLVEVASSEFMKGFSNVLLEILQNR